MTTLRETYEAMHRVLRGEVSPAEAAPRLGVDAERLAIYQGFAEGHVVGILAKQFPRLIATLPGAVVAALSRGFFRSHPPTGWDLNEAARAFPAYLATQRSQIAELSHFHLALARFEWEQWVVYSAPTAMPDPAELEGLTLNPTLSILELPCPVVSHVIAHDRGEEDLGPLPTLAMGPERVLLFRHPERETCAYWRASERLILAIATVHGGLSVDASALAHDCAVDLVDDALQHAQAIGLCLGPR